MERLAEHLGGQGRGQDVDQVVAEQHRADHRSPAREISRLTRAAARSPSRSSWCMRPRLAPVSAVSAAENTPETASSARITGATANELCDHGRAPSSIRKVGQAADVDVLGHERLADAAGQDKRERPATRLLVLRHVPDKAPALRAGLPAMSASCVGRPAAAIAPLGARCVVGWGRGRPPRRSGKPSAEPSATASPCRSASPKPVSASSAWPKVWPRLSRARRPCLALVLGDDLGLHLHRAADGVRQRRGVAGQHARAVGLQPGEERRIAQQAVLDDLGVAAAHLARRQAVEHVQVGQHQPRLVEGADQVLAARRIDRGLAADRGVDLGQQGGRDLHEVDAALVDRGREAGEIADHAAAEAPR